MGLRNIDASAGDVDVDAINAAIAAAQSTADTAAGGVETLASLLGDVSTDATTALNNAQSAYDLAGLAATQLDFNALADDLHNPMRPREYRWVSNIITEADFTPGDACTLALAGAVSLPGEYLTTNMYIVLGAGLNSTDLGTTTLLVGIGTSKSFIAMNNIDLLTENGRSSGGAYFGLGALIKTTMFAYFNTLGGDLSHIDSLSMRVVIDYKLPAES